MTYNRGDVVVVLFPQSDLTTSKPRPALIVQADQLGTGIPQVVMAMITSNMRRASHASRVTVLNSSPEGRQMGLRSDSVIMADNLMTVLEKAIHRKIGSCGDMGAVDTALRHTLGL